MSYKKKKKKKNIINQLKRQVGLIKIVLLKKYKLFIQKNRNMQLRQTRLIMQWLRDRSRTIRPNNLRINDWVDEYINKCILNGKPVEILTQYCLSKNLEKRYEIQGNRFMPLAAEQEMFNRDIPKIIEMFESNNVSVNWFITFNDSFMEKGRVSGSITEKYIKMIESLVKNKETLLLNWENDILNGRPTPNQDILANFFQYISLDAYKIAMDDLVKRTQKMPDYEEIKQGFDEGLRFKISCEAEEGRILINGETSLFQEKGQFILVPLEFPERYVFFEALAPGFQKRIVSILKPYPWRMNTDELGYE